ncbi:unnamed protein product [Moneuplotes crassus]|uniref:Uncharacterized protein n=1 Tax=Euplotes crassus TaxID=5936 RepID=A0AAD1UC70_EUPCR|nr:unnamed protein product [Moneuplotes crassus]
MEMNTFGQETPVVDCIEELSENESGPSLLKQPQEDNSDHQTSSLIRIMTDKVVCVVNENDSCKPNKKIERNHFQGSDIDSVQSKERTTTLSAEKLDAKHLEVLTRAANTDRRIIESKDALKFTLNINDIPAEVLDESIKPVAKLGSEVPAQYLSREFGENLLKNLQNFNSVLDTKHKDIARIREHLVTLENNINRQVDEFLKDMVSTNMSLEKMLLDPCQENQSETLIDNLCLKLYKNYLFESNHKINLTFYRELKVIKDYILGLDMGQRNHQIQRIPQALGVSTLQELLNDFRPSGERPKADLVDKLESRSHSKYLDSSNSQAKENNSKINLSFEDEQFTQSLQKKFRSPMKLNTRKRIQRERLHSTSVFERRLRPQPLDFQLGMRRECKFKESESQNLDSANNFPILNLNDSPALQPSLPFAADIKIDPGTITQMLIQRLSKNNELVHLNDLCRILPDTDLKKSRSYSQQI